MRDSNECCEAIDRCERAGRRDARPPAKAEAEVAAVPYRHTGIRSLCFAAAAAAAAAAAIHSTTTATSFNVHSALKSIGGAAAAAVANSEVCEERAVCGRRRCHSTTATATVCVSACAEAKVTAERGVRGQKEVK